MQLTHKIGKGRLADYTTMASNGRDFDKPAIVNPSRIAGVSVMEQHGFVPCRTIEHSEISTFRTSGQSTLRLVRA